MATGFTVEATDGYNSSSSALTSATSTAATSVDDFDENQRQPDFNGDEEEEEKNGANFLLRLAIIVIDIIRVCRSPVLERKY